MVAWCAGEEYNEDVLMIISRAPCSDGIDGRGESCILYWASPGCMRHSPNLLAVSTLAVRDGEADVEER